MIKGFIFGRVYLIILKSTVRCYGRDQIEGRPHPINTWRIHRFNSCSEVQVSSTASRELCRLRPRGERCDGWKLIATLIKSERLPDCLPVIRSFDFCLFGCNSFNYYYFIIISPEFLGWTPYFYLFHFRRLLLKRNYLDPILFVLIFSDQLVNCA